MNRNFLAIATICSAALASTALADAPTLQTKGPIIYLADNLDEADKLGWCIDTVGRGLSDKLHAHSCKPRGSDVLFRFDSETGQIQSAGFEGKCAETSTTTETDLALLDCDPENADQKFSFDPETGQITLASDSKTCLAVGTNSRSAGPFMSRDLLTVAFDSVDAELRTWMVRGQ